MLIELFNYTGDKKFLEPIPAAIEWLEKSNIGDNLWDQLFDIPKDSWDQDMESRSQFFAKFGNTLPKEIFYEHDAMKNRLDSKCSDEEEGSCGCHNGKNVEGKPQGSCCN